MNGSQSTGSGARWLAAGIGLAAASYVSYVALTWFRYGHPAQPTNPQKADSLLDRFMPAYEVVERHHVRIAAPAETTFSAACDMNLLQSAIVRGMFRGRELILGSKPEERLIQQGLVAQAKAWGWGVLAEEPGREIVFGAVTEPWLPNSVFRALPPRRVRGLSRTGLCEDRMDIACRPH